MTIRKIIEDYLLGHGYGGLVSQGGCVCTIDDLYCGQGCEGEEDYEECLLDCEPGKAVILTKENMQYIEPEIIQDCKEGDTVIMTGYRE